MSLALTRCLKIFALAAFSISISVQIGFGQSTINSVDANESVPKGAGTVWSISAQDVAQRLSILASDSLAGRRSGQPGAAKAARYIADEFARLGLSPIDSTRSFMQPFEFSEHAMDTSKHGTTKAMNVIGFLSGYDANLRNEVVVIGAHYDHLGMGGANALDSVKAIHYGADDNASGTAGLLELAEYYSKNRFEVKRSILFIAFSGEEEGLFGSKYYVEHPLLPLKNTQAMINLDMIGRLSVDSNMLILEGMGTSPAWKDMVTKLNEESKFNLHLKQTGRGPSDQASFYSKEIPVIFFFTGLHSDYHRATDTPDKINCAGEEKVLTMVQHVATTLANAPERIAFTKVAEDTAQTSTTWSVYVGGVPDYGYEGDGLKISEVTDNSPAFKAGLKKGDIVIGYNGAAIKTIYDYTKALHSSKVNDVVTFKIKREMVTLEIPVTLGRRPVQHD